MMEGKLITDCKFCGNCHFTDGMIYMSNPPKVKCDFTGEYRDRNDLCSVELKPVVHGRWEWSREDGTTGWDYYRCFNCKKERREDEIDATDENFCFNRGATMDLKEGDRECS